MAVKSPSCISSRLNPNAPHFVPSYFESVEDFSPEWWNLVKTCPAFRDFWIRERWEAFNMTDALAGCEEIEEFPEFDEDLDEELACAEDGKPLETLKEQDVNTPPKSPRVVKFMDLVPHNVVENVPRQARQKILQVPPKLAAAQMRKSSMAFRIQQPR